MAHSSAEITVRQASPIDLNRITEICLQGLPDDATFDYLWRYRSQYPDDNHFFWQQRLKANLFDARRVFLVAVLQESVNAAESNAAEEKVLSVADRQEGMATPGTRETIIAFALWEINVKDGPKIWQRRWLDIFHDCLTSLENWGLARKYQRRDGDPHRIAEFTSALDNVHERYWEKTYPRNYHLELLVTHPAYRRRGAGTKLTRWGMDKASASGAHVGVESSLMGFYLYQSLNFRLREHCVVRVKDEVETLDIRIMVLEHAAKE